MLIRTTVNAQPPRTLADMARDSWDWCDGPHRSTRPRAAFFGLLRDAIAGPPPPGREVAYAAATPEQQWADTAPETDKGEQQ